MAIADIRNNQHFEPLGIYAMAFLDSASALFRRADEGAGLVDYAIYPAAFNLRHGLELFIKQMSIYAAYEMNDSSLLYLPGHDLEQAWQSVKEYVTDIVDHDYGGERHKALSHLDVVSTTIEQLHEMDPRGTLFRYPEDVKDAKPAKKKKPRARTDQPPPFDMVNLADWAAISASTFGAVQYLLDNSHERAESLAHQHGDPPIHFHETVMKRGEQGAKKK